MDECFDIAVNFVLNRSCPALANLESTESTNKPAKEIQAENHSEVLEIIQFAAENPDKVK